jgi:hypothetical protein
MFSSFTSRLRSEIDTLKLVLDTHDALRGVVFSQPALPPANGDGEQNSGLEPESGAAAGDDPLAGIRKRAPAKSSWQVYDHCAAFTRLYAVYEQFIEELVSDYLRMLPTLYSQYGELPGSVARQHRVGVGQILLKLGKDGPYKEFDEMQIVQGLSRGLSGSPDYTLLPDAFLIDPQNYRTDAVVKLFSYVGFENCWAWVEKHPLMTAFMQSRDSNETAKTLLHDFIDYRNKASHTAVADIVSIDEVKSVANFVMVLSEVLAQLVMKQAVERMKTIGKTMDVGTVIHKFSSNVVGVDMLPGELAVGDELVVLQKYACFKTQVVSLRIADAQHGKLSLTEARDVGVKLTCI